MAGRTHPQRRLRRARGIGPRSSDPRIEETAGTPVHRPVLVEEVLEALVPARDGVVVDATVGLAGHAAAALEHFPALRLVGLDVDAEALELGRQRLAPYGARATLLQASFWDLTEVLAAIGVTVVDGVLFDLGVSSLQLDTPERGFSFRYDAPLDMRFARHGVTAAEWLAGVSEEELVRVLREFGEEPAARRVARAIDNARRGAPIRTTGELRRIVVAATRGRGSRIDPATRTFQALRIVTNRELDGIPAAIDQAARLLRPAGRLAVIAFHSLEDRLVKRTLRRLSGRCICPPGSFACQCSPETLLDVVTQKPVRPGAAEVETNPRARSARLRIAERRRG